MRCGRLVAAYGFAVFPEVVVLHWNEKRRTSLSVTRPGWLPDCFYWLAVEGLRFARVSPGLALRRSG